MSAKPFTLPLKLRADAATYYEALADECKRLKVDPVAALHNADQFPRLQKIPVIEYIIGWFAGVSACLTSDLRAVWLASEAASKAYGSRNMVSLNKGDV
jgi:hypothetical protein